MKHPIGYTRNGVFVYVDLIRSQAATYIAQQPRMLELVKKALSKTDAEGTEVTVEHNMGRAIGYNFVVTTTDSDTTFYAQLVKDSAYTRFVKNGKPRTTQYLTVILKRNEQNEYELHDTWLGRKRPPRPGTDSETAESLAFWENHAFILDNQPIQSRTITKTRPY